MLLSTFATQPSDFWHDPFWEFIISVAVATFLGLIAIIISLWIFRKQRIRKEISYEIVSDAPIANINEDVKERVEIRFDGKPVKDMSVVVLRVLNTGNKAVTATDYDKPLKFDFVGREVVDGNVLDMSSKEVLENEEIKTFLTYEKENLILKPTLLNPKESITIKALVAGPNSTIKATARIVEGKLVEYDSNNRKGIYPLIQTIPFLSAIVTLLLFLGFGTAFAGYIDQERNLILVGIFMIIFSLLFGVTYYSILQESTKLRVSRQERS